MFLKKSLENRLYTLKYIGNKYDMRSSIAFYTWEQKTNGLTTTQFLKLVTVTFLTYVKQRQYFKQVCNFKQFCGEAQNILHIDGFKTTVY